MKPKDSARTCRNSTPKTSRHTARHVGKRSTISPAPPPPATAATGNGADNSALPLAPGLPSPWSGLEFELRDRGTREHSLLLITDRGKPIGQLVLHPKQTTLVRFLFAKAKENATAPRDERLTPSEELMDELDRRHFDPKGNRVATRQQVYDSMNKVRDKLRATKPGRDLAGMLGRGFDLGMILIMNDKELHGYAIGVPASQIKITKVSPGEPDG